MNIFYDKEKPLITYFSAVVNNLFWKMLCKNEEILVLLTSQAETSPHESPSLPSSSHFLKACVAKLYLPQSMLLPRFIISPSAPKFEEYVKPSFKNSPGC